MKLIILLLLSINTFAGFRDEINVKKPPFNAVGNGIADDWAAIQGAIDSAVKLFGSIAVYIPPGTYKITKPLIAAKWNSFYNRYDQCTVRIYGDDLMWSQGICIIKPTFKDGFALGLHLNKGSVVSGLFFDGMYRAPNISNDSLYRSPITYGDSTCRDTRFSPYSGIVIDPFRHNLPADGGYPQLTSWYRGSTAVSGSTGVRIEDCTIRNFTVSIILSPNGYTLNNELITMENIRINDCKVAFAGCQAQEKQNRLINWGIWGRVRIAFMFGNYGAGTPGHYNISGVNIAGNVVQLLQRYSQGYFPMFINDVFAENLGTIGIWNGNVGDAMTNCTINFLAPSLVKSFPNVHVEGSGTTYTNVNIRYYGNGSLPMLMKGNNTFINSQSAQYVKHIRGTRYLAVDADFQNGFELLLSSATFVPFYFQNGIKKARLQYYAYQGVINRVVAGDIMVFSANTDYAYYGMGQVESSDSTGYVVSLISPGIKSDFKYIVSKYVSR